jgi:hypothetical protein
MVDLEGLRARGLRVYEAARLRMALRATLLLVPIFAACWSLGDRELCACLMPVMATLVIWLRWRDRRGVEDVSVGLLAGAVPLVVGLVLTSLGAHCGGTLCWLFSASAGIAAGAWVAADVRRRGSTRSSWLAATSIAAAAAALGCSALGALGIAGVVGGVAAGSLLGAALPHAEA